MALDPRPGERVYQEIKQAILSGELILLQRLDIDKLASKLGVSATPVRNALGILAAERLVKLNASRVYEVAFWSERELKELYEWRYQLARWAVDGFEPSSSPALRPHDYVWNYLTLMQQLDASANAEARRAARAADDRLHAALRVEDEVMGDAQNDIARLGAALTGGGPKLPGTLRKYFKRRIAHCGLIRAAAHAKAMPRNGE